MGRMKIKAGAFLLNQLSEIAESAKTHTSGRAPLKQTHCKKQSHSRLQDTFPKLIHTRVKAADPIKQNGAPPFSTA